MDVLRDEPQLRRHFPPTPFALDRPALLLLDAVRLSLYQQSIEQLYGVLPDVAVTTAACWGGYGRVPLPRRLAEKSLVRLPVVLHPVRRLRPLPLNVPSTPLLVPLTVRCFAMRLDHLRAPYDVPTPPSVRTFPSAPQTAVLHWDIAVRWVLGVWEPNVRNVAGYIFQPIYVPLDARPLLLCRPIVVPR
jgi:hypothetical protein